MEDAKLIRFKTVLCTRVAKGQHCRFGGKCLFAHSEGELRRNLQHHWYFPVLCNADAGQPPCGSPHCPLAHNQLELVYHPYLYKTQLCGEPQCARQGTCWMAHGEAELREAKQSVQPMEARPAAVAAASPPFAASSSSAAAPPPATEEEPSDPETRAFVQSADALKLELLAVADRLGRLCHERGATSAAGRDALLHRLNGLVRDAESQLQQLRRRAALQQALVDAALVPRAAAALSPTVRAALRQRLRAQLAALDAADGGGEQKDGNGAATARCAACGAGARVKVRRACFHVLCANCRAGGQCALADCGVAGGGSEALPVLTVQHLIAETGVASAAAVTSPAITKD